MKILNISKGKDNMARISGVDLPANKSILIGLTYIYGIGDRFSNEICKALEIPKSPSTKSK